MTNCLVTGGAGFIGSFVTDLLISKGFGVVVVDNMSKGQTQNIHPDARFEKLDINDTDGMEQVFNKYHPQFVFHYAAQIDIDTSIADPVHDAEENIMAGLKLIDLSARNGVKKFIFSSSGGAIYGDTEFRPTPERHPEWPESPYGITKLTIDKYLDFYSRYKGMKSVSLRYSNVYGPRQIPHGEACVVAIFMNMARSGQVPTIYGDGQQTRDFLYVTDAAHAAVDALEKDVTGVFNIATGIETTIDTLWKTIGQVAGITGEAPHDLTRSPGQKTSCLDATKAHTILGWKPRVGLVQGIQQTWESGDVLKVAEFETRSKVRSAV